MQKYSICGTLPGTGGSTPTALNLLSADWSDRYAAWIAQARPRLQAREWSVAFADYPWPTFDDAPLTPLRVGLGVARVALVSSAGLTVPGQPPFDADDAEGDTSFRWVSDPGPLSSWRIDHGHYDPGAAREDYNAVFPLDVLRGLADRGEIGSLAPRQVSFMGYQTDVAEWLRTSVPAIADGFRADAVDAALLVPV